MGEIFNFDDEATKLGHSMTTMVNENFAVSNIPKGVNELKEIRTQADYDYYLDVLSTPDLVDQPIFQQWKSNLMWWEVHIYSEINRMRPAEKGAAQHAYLRWLNSISGRQRPGILVMHIVRSLEVNLERIWGAKPNDGRAVWARMGGEKRR